MFAGNIFTNGSLSAKFAKIFHYMVYYALSR